MGLSLKKITGSIRDIFDANTASDIAKRGGQTYQQQAQTRGGLGGTYARAQVANQNINNSLTNGRLQQAVPMAVKKMSSNPVGNYLLGGNTGTARSLGGIAQDVSGFADLVTPGLGTNRFTQGMERFNKGVDNFAQTNNINKFQYKAGQAATDLATFAVPGGLMSKGITKVAPGLAKAGTLGRVTAKALPTVANVGTDIVQGVSRRTAKEQDNNLGTLGMDTAMSLGTAGLLYGGGKLAGKVIKNAPKVASKVGQALETPTKRIDDLIIQNQKAWDVETNPTHQKQINQKISDLIAERRSISEGGYIKNPLAKDPLRTDTSKLATNVLQNEEIVRSVMNGGIFKMRLDNGKVIAFGDHSILGRVGNGIGDDVTDVIPVAIGRGKSGNASTGQPRLILENQNSLIQLKQALGETVEKKQTVSERLREKWGEPVAKSQSPLANDAPQGKTRTYKTSVGDSISDLPTEVISTDGGYIRILKDSPYAPDNRTSIVKVMTDEGSRRQGVGSDLVQQAIDKHGNISAFAENEASQRMFYKKGLRPLDEPNASLERTLAIGKEQGGGVTMVNDIKSAPQVGKTDPNNWRNAVDGQKFGKDPDTNANILSDKQSTMREIARVSRSDKELSDILDRAEALKKDGYLGDNANLAWDVQNNPGASGATKARASKLYKEITAPQGKTLDLGGDFTVKMSSKGNIYIKMPNGEVVTKVPKTIQGDLYAKAQGEILTPDRAKVLDDWIGKNTQQTTSPKPKVVGKTPISNEQLLDIKIAKVKDLYNQATQSQPPKSPLANDAPKPKATSKTAEGVSSIDPTDPFGNKNIIKKVRNELGSLVDDDAQMLNMLRKIEKDTGQKGLVDQWYFDSGNVRQSTSIANAKLKNSADLDTALSGLSKKDLDGLDAYTAARAELKNYDGMKTSKNSDDLAKIVAEGDAKYGERFGALNSYYKNMAQDMKDAGLIDDSTLKKYLESDDYVRIQRDMEELVNGQYGGSGSRSIGSTSAKQKRTGSTREVVAPTKSLLKRTQQIELEIQRNKASTNIINVLEENGLATRVKDPKSKNVVSRIVDGKKETFEVPGDIKKVIENVNPYQLGIIARVVSTPSRLLRAGTTALSAPFALTNYARDQASSAMVSKAARATHKPTAILSGLGSAIRDTVDESHNPLWKKFEAFAGDSTVFDELRNAKSSDRMLRELTQGRVGKYKNMVTAPVRTLEDLNGITEKATRFQNFKGVYEKVLKETGDEQKAVQQAVLAARQNSVDFGRNSSFTRVMNLVFPYFNASIQGSRTVARSFRDRPVATGIKTGLMGSAVLGITAYNMSDEKRREVYNSINDFEKEDNFIIVGPDAVQTDSGSWEGVYKIPKPQGFREIVDPISDMAQAYFNGESVEDTTTMLTDMLSAFTGPIDTSSQTAFIGSLTPQAIKPSVELAMNKSLYTGKDIVPQFMKDGTDDPTKRAFKSTSGSAQWIADQLGVSPIQVEAFIKGTGGSLGLYGLNASDNILAKTGKISEENIGGRSALGDIKRRTLEASGEKLEKNKSAGQKYFEGVNIVKEPLRGGDKAAFDTLHQSKTNFLGEEIFDENKRITKYTRAGIYLNNPNVLDADVKLDAIQRQNGNPGNPLFDLPKPLLTKVLLKDALPPGAKDPELSNLYKEEWYQDYQNERSKWYEGIKGKLEAEGKTMPKSTNPYPTTPKPLQKAMDAYSALPKGTGERSGWIKANPGLWQQMTAQWAQVDAWENNERVAIGLAPIVEDPNATSKYGSGGGKKSDPSLNPLKYAVSTKSTAKGPTISLRTGGAGRRVTLKAPTGAPKVTTKKSLV